MPTVESINRLIHESRLRFGASTILISVLGCSDPGSDELCPNGDEPSDLSITCKPEGGCTCGSGPNEGEACTEDDSDMRCEKFCMVCPDDNGNGGVLGAIN